MAKHEKFNFTELSQLRSRAEELGTDLHFSEDISILSKPVKVGKAHDAERICSPSHGGM